MNVITISREFGSGGRELGKKLAQILGYDYYDHQIIAELAKRRNLDENYIRNIEDGSFIHSIPFFKARTFHTDVAMKEPKIQLLLEQKKVLEEIAQKGRNLVIVGRNADTILKDYHPLSLFVFADLDARLSRTMDREKDLEGLSHRQLKASLKQIDRNRSRTREMIGGKSWKDKTAFDLLINTTNRDLDSLAQALASYIFSLKEKTNENPAL